MVAQRPEVWSGWKARPPARLSRGLRLRTPDPGRSLVAVLAWSRDAVFADQSTLGTVPKTLVPRLARERRQGAPMV